tara:strand:+ start:411 stop:602 length:192 start_codon:yes stop_codon:yes gene_type:complete
MLDELEETWLEYVRKEANEQGVDLNDPILAEEFENALHELIEEKQETQLLEALEDQEQEYAHF